jgi:hypothetical protein
MKASKLQALLEQSFKAKRRVLIKGKPGIGKSDIVLAASNAVGADMILMHPSISDPTDFKGMPAKVGDRAEFLPFGDLCKLIEATKLTVCFQDDIGQAAPAVQAALMQLNLARRVNGHRISDHVVFVGATNDTAHMAGVSGMIEPLKSRFDAIIELEVSTDDWCNWALDNGLPPVMVAFIRFRPALLSDFKPTKELRNSPCPRTWASVAKWYDMGVRDLEVYAGAVGEGAAGEFVAFCDLWTQLPALESILMNPDSTEVPESPAALYAVAAMLAKNAADTNFDRMVKYLNRMPTEFNVMCVKDAVRLSEKKDKAGKTVNPLTATPAFVTWATKHSNVIL